jgi:putative membrane protein
MDLEKWTVSSGVLFFGGALVAYLVTGVVPAQTPDTWWFLILSVAMAICAMILPGISGAFILVLLGKYHLVLEAVNQRDLTTLLLVAGGACIGLLTFVRVLNYFFRNYRAQTIARMTGFMLRSLRKVWPWKDHPESLSIESGTQLIAVNILPETLDMQIAAAVGLMLLGFAVVWGMSLLARKIRVSSVNES